MVVFTINLISLNSTLVQFKLSTSTISFTSLFKASQFHFGSIQTNRSRCVRNKDLRLKSQFHFGSIQTKSFLPSSDETLYSSQFHFGSIQTAIQSYQILQWLISSQFHFGSIQTNNGNNKLKFQKRVSIPLWFNSNQG